MSPEEILLFLNRSLSQAANAPLYRGRLKTQPLSSLAELKNLPLTTKEELRNSFPYGGLAVPKKSIVELHTTSATTGRPAVSFFTREDMTVGSRYLAKAWSTFGINDSSVVQFMMAYGLFSGAAMNTYALQVLGALVVPAGIQSTENQVQMMLDYGVDTIVATPSYYFYLHHYLEEKGIPVSRLKLQRGIAAGEVYSEAAQNQIAELFQMPIYNHYGLCEVYTGIAYQCEKRQGLHLVSDLVLAEVIDPKTEKVLPAGIRGELVLTSLRKEASPIVRYRTGDLTHLIKDPCPCGDPNPQIDRIYARCDDLLFIRGIKINPHELKELILNRADGRIHPDIQIIIDSHSLSSPRVLVAPTRDEDLAVLEELMSFIKRKTSLTFCFEAVSPEHFRSAANTKVKLVHRDC